MPYHCKQQGPALLPGTSDKRLSRLEKVNGLLAEAPNPV
jgi:hypothetical protein